MVRGSAHEYSGDKSGGETEDDKEEAAGVRGDTTDDCPPGGGNIFDDGEGTGAV